MSLFSDSSRAEKIGQGGFSLVEAMVAIVIFAIGILGAYKMQLHSTQSNALANRVSTATTLAGYAIEEILGKPYDHDDLKDDDGNGKNGLTVMNDNADGVMYIYADGSKDTTDGGQIYSIYWNIVDGDPNDTTTKRKNEVLIDTKLIQVHVKRNGGIGNGLLYTHDYYKALYPES